MTRTGSLALLLLATASLAASDWPQFRGPDGTGVAAAGKAPVNWSATANVRWKIDLPGRGVSNPVIAAGRVYVTASSGYRQDRLHVLCHDIQTGKKLWERQFGATGSTITNPKTCTAGAAPVTDGAAVYALFHSGDAVCLDRDGNLLWYRSLARDYPLITNQVGMAASPILYKDVLIVPVENAGDSFVAGLDKHTGKNLWRYERARAINWTTPLLVRHGGGAEVLFQSANELTAYDPEDGTRRWAHAGKGLSTMPSPVAAGENVLVPGGDFVALRLVTDKGSPEVAWKNNKLNSSSATPLFYHDRIYTVNSARVLNCADPKDGKILWQQRTGLTGQIWASPVAADGKVYVTSEDGGVAVVQVGDKPKLLASNMLEEAFLATPAIADGALFLRSDKHLYCIEEKDGR